jgi:hypothetical protein
MRIQDNIDSNIAWYKVLNDSEQLFESINANIPQIINDHLSRNAYYRNVLAFKKLFYYSRCITFSLTPFGLAVCLSTLGTPLALWAFINLGYRVKTWRRLIIITILPFYSTFMLGFFFFLSAMGVFGLLMS